MTVTAAVASDTPEAGADHDLAIELDSGDPLEEGETVEWQLPHSWTERYGGASYTKPLQATDPGGEHYVYTSAPGAEFDVEIFERQLPDTEMSTRHGRHVVATLVEGPVPAGKRIEFGIERTTAPAVAGTEPAWIRVAGRSPDEEVTLATRPAEAQRVRVLVPSGAEPGESFEVRIVPLDRFDNAADAAYADERLATLDDALDRELSFRGSTTVAASLADPGVYWFRFDGTLSNPVRVEEDAHAPYWGDVHVHTGLSHDGQGADPYTYAREVSGLDFAATTDHVETLSEVGNERALERTARANDPGSFVTVPAYEITLPREYEGGHYNLYFGSERAYRDWIDHTGNLDSTQTSQVDVDLITGEGSAEAPSELLVAPHHTGIGFAQCDPADLPATDQAPVLEIYSHHGQSERYDPQHALSYEFNRYRRPERRSNQSVPGPYYAQDFWARGHRMGAIASSDEHTGQPGRSRSGCAAVLAEDLSREGLFEALRNRACYATTGERILIEFDIGGARMGERLAVEPGESLEGRLEVRGSDVLIDVELLRCGESEEAFSVVHSETPYPSAEDAKSRTPEALTSVVEFDVEVTGDCCYYARVTQDPVEWPAMAWTSPIWIDVTE